MYSFNRSIFYSRLDLRYQVNPTFCWQISRGWKNGSCLFLDYYRSVKQKIDFSAWIILDPNITSLLVDGECKTPFTPPLYQIRWNSRCRYIIIISKALNLFSIDILMLFIESNGSLCNCLLFNEAIGFFWPALLFPVFMDQFSKQRKTVTLHRSTGPNL